MKKKGATGQVGALVAGIIGLVFLVVVGYVSLDILLTSDLLTAGGSYNASAARLTNNLTEGVGNVATKIPTMFTIAAAVLLLGLIVFLVLRARQTQAGQGGTI